MTLATTIIMGVKAYERLGFREGRLHHASKKGAAPYYDATPLHCDQMT